MRGRMRLVLPGLCAALTIFALASTAAGQSEDHGEPQANPGRPTVSTPAHSRPRRRESLGGKLVASAQSCRARVRAWAELVPACRESFRESFPVINLSLATGSIICYTSLGYN